MIGPNKEDFDDMHHALGRPKDYEPNHDTFRNRYCIAADGHTSTRFRELGWWDEGCRINQGRDILWHVNDAGKRALADWLRKR